MYNHSATSDSTRSYSDKIDGVILMHLLNQSINHNFLLNTKLDAFTSSQTRLLYNFVKQRF